MVLVPPGRLRGSDRSYPGKARALTADELDAVFIPAEV